MDKTYHSRTNISNEVLLLMAKVSMLTKQLNGLTLAEQPQKQEIIKEYAIKEGDTGSTVTLVKTSMWAKISMLTTTARCSTWQRSA